MRTESTEVLATVALGGNLSNPDHTMRLALHELGSTPGVRLLKTSRFFRTRPVDAPGPDFCNAAALLATTFSALRLLETLLAIEMRFGRVRAQRNAPRTLDLDLITHGDARINTPQLILPHPRAHTRAFVLLPLCEVAPDALLGPSEADTLSPAAEWLTRLAPAASVLSQW